MPTVPTGSLRRLACVLALTTGTTACVRWGVSDEDDYDSASDSDGSTTSTSTSDSDSSTTAVASTGDDTPIWPEPWPIDPSARVVVWGRTGIPTRNLPLFENFLRELGSDAGGETSTSAAGTEGSGSSTGTGTTGADTDGTGDGTGGGSGGASSGPDTDGTGTGGEPPPPAGAVAILWIADCDPRQDELGCLAGNVAPFFEMVDGIGTIDFRPLSAVDARAYDVVVADFCGPVDPQQVGQLLGDGAHVLVLGDWWCASSAGVSADVANVVLERIGARFVDAQLYNHAFLVPGTTGSALVNGIETIDAWGVALQETTSDFETVLVTADGAVITTRQ